METAKRLKKAVLLGQATLLVCPKCKSDDVSRDGTIRYGSFAADSYVSDIFEDLICDACGCESSGGDLITRAIEEYDEAHVVRDWLDYLLEQSRSATDLNAAAREIKAVRNAVNPRVQKLIDSRIERLKRFTAKF